MLAVLTLLVALAPAPAPSPVVARVTQAYGGEAAVRHLARMQAEGTILSRLHGTGRYARVSDGPMRLRVETAYPDERELRVLWDAEATRNGAAVQGPLADAMRLHAARLALPLLLLERASEVEDLGELTVDGARLRALQLAFDAQHTLVAFLDPATSRIVRSQAIAGPIVFEATYEDFRVIDGVLVPFRETTRAMGQPAGVVMLERVRFLAKGEDARQTPLRSAR